MTSSGGKPHKAYEKELLGKKILKNFGSFGDFLGTITDIWYKGSVVYAHIHYEDGDEEDMSLSSMRPLLVQDAKRKPPSSAGATVKKEKIEEKKRKVDVNACFCLFIDQ